MIESMSFQNLASITIDLNDGAYPIHLFDTPITSRLEKRTRSGADGMWPTYTYLEGMEITLEGAILADDSDDYYTKRQALIDVLRYTPTTPERRSGVFFVEFDNAPEGYRTDVAIDSISIPRDGASPNYSEFRIVLFSFVPYYIGVDSGDPYYDN